VSAKRPIEIFCQIGVTSNSWKKRLNQPIAGLTLLTFFATTVPAPSNAQTPTLPPPPNPATTPNPAATPNPATTSIPPAVPVPPPPGTLPAPPSTAGPGEAEVPSFTTPKPSPEIPPVPDPRLPSGDPSNPPPVTPYTLGAGDRVRVDVFEVPEYSGEVSVLVDGTINLPVIGTVLVAGQSLQDAGATISGLYKLYVRRPIVTVSLVAARPVNLAIAGEVSRPGTYTVTPSQAGAGGGPGAGQFPTVTQLISLAGGTTQAADVGRVVIQRRGVKYTVNLWDLLKNGNIAQDVQLRDGDSVIIDTVAQINPLETRTLADASFTSRQIQPINVAIVGEVSRPGPYEITGGGVATGGATGAITGTTTGVAGATGAGNTGGPPTVTKAIQVAGGITSQADVRSITIRRPTRSGVYREISVNLWEMLRTGDLSQDVILQTGDTITIPTATALDPAEASQLASASFAPNTIVVNVVGEVTRPGAIPVPPNTPLNQAILAAGGFNNVRARKGKVELIRLNPNGSVTKREVNVDLAQGINESGNPALRNNDVVVVGRNTLTRVGDTLSTVLSPVTNFLTFLNIFRIFGQ
jgi:polysaccharide export outer membrane protein